MKFTINSKDFKSAIEKVSLCLNLKSTHILARSVHIYADSLSGKVIFSGTNFEQSVSIQVNCFIIENGEGIVEYSTIKKLLSIPGEITITTDDIRLIASNEKKTSECCLVAIDFDKSIYSVSDLITTDNLISVFKSTDFIKTLCNVGKFVSTNEAKPESTGIYFDGFNRKMSSCDGNRLCVYDMSEWGVLSDKNFIMPGVIPDILKKISGKACYDFKLYANDKYICICCDDFYLKTMCIKGIYPEYERGILSTPVKFTNQINLDEFIITLKEYKNILKGEKVKGQKVLPVVMYFTNNKLYTSAFTSDFRTVDNVELVETNYTDEFIIGFNPQLLIESIQLYHSENINPVFHYYSPITAIKITGGKYTLAQMPVRINCADHIDKLSKYIR